MSEGTIDDTYFEWLYAQIGSVRNRNPGRSHWKCAKQLYVTPFEWFVHNDDNRIEDGYDLRWEFLSENIASADPIWMGLQCSMLEMMVALARRASFESSGTPGDWFWHMAGNVGLRHLTDAKYTTTTEHDVKAVLHTIIDRTYSSTGEGGFFPLKNPHHDQRRVELWNQLSAYLLENDFLETGPR